METIGKYRIEEKIGSGGFGEVFRAYDPFIKRHVAIKTCRTDDSDIASRFSQEAEIGGNLHHRNVTTVYDFGVHEGLPYLVQEYLTGEDLDVKIKRRDYLPYSEKLLYLLQIARGLAYAHARGIVHRDVKPANVRVLEDGTAKIMDFGIAKLAQQESGLTQTGMTLGSAAYLAPEQVRGDDVDPRTDVFSFGVLAYELMTYVRPFQGEQISTVLYNLLHHEPEPITCQWPAAPAQLVALIDRCMRKDAGQRFADGNAVVQELEELKKRGRDGGLPDETSSIRQPAPAPADAREPAVRAEPSSASSHGASGLEFRRAPELAPTVALAAATSARRSPPTSVTGAATLIVLAAIAAAGGWWLGTRGNAFEPDTAQTPPSIAEPAEAPPADAEAEAAEPPLDAMPEPAAEASASETPPAPATGRLILPRVPWTDRMTARVGDRSYPLDRRHELELPPGIYSAVFELDAPGYRPASRTVEVRVTAGESSGVEAPIPRPGAFSVRPLPGRPQGRVTLDGELVGPTPLSEVRREPGVYTLEILPRSGDDEGLRQEITLEAGRETILSFDLDAGAVRTRVKDLVL